MLGGGFGRRGAYPDDYVTQAVLIAKQMPGTPIKMLWSREEDMLHGRYHPIMQSRLVGGLDASGNLTGLHMRLSGQSILAAVRPEVVQAQKGRDPLSFQGVFESGEHSFSYTVPNLLIDHAMRNTHVPPGFWRGVNINQNALFIECFMDELAEAAGQDALEFRRKLMAKHPWDLGVLHAVAERIGWSKPAPSGVHRGLAHLHCFDSFVAAACEISVKDGNKVKVHRIVAATDPGYAVNPAQIERQVAGSFVYGLSAAFFHFFFSSRRRHTRCSRDWSSDVCSSDLYFLRDTFTLSLLSLALLLGISENEREGVPKSLLFLPGNGCGGDRFRHSRAQRHHS